MAEVDLQELNEQFGVPNKDLEPDVVSELRSIMRMHSLSAQDLYFKWESYCIKMDMDGNSLSVESLRALKQDIQDALERSNRAHQVHIKTEKRSSGTPRNAVKSTGDVYGMLEGMVPNTPAAGKLNKSASKRRIPHDTPSITRVKGDILSSSPDYKNQSPLKIESQLDSMNIVSAASFNDRPNPGEVIEILNEHLKPPEPVIVPYAESRVKLNAASDLKKLGYKTLAMKSSEASEILDDRIDEFSGLVRDQYNIDEAEFGSAASQSTTEIVAVGRIASDSSEGKLNAASLVLETSRRTGGGLRIPLNLQKLSGRYQFFPGQITAFRGINSSGKEFAVREVLEMPLLPNAASSPMAIEAHRERLRGGPDAMESDDEPAPLNVIIGSGPYSADDNLDFEPLHTLCSQAADTCADALILTGPFIDVDHPLIATGDFDLPEEAGDLDSATMSTVFKYMISPALNRLVASNPTITILLIPSVRDVVDRHVSWPQDLILRKDLGLAKAARIVGNPMTLFINEMLLGISSQDVLWDLRHEELVGGRAEESNFSSRAPRYLIEQRHYFPIFPPVDRQKLPKAGTEDGLPTGAMLDLSYLKLGEMMDVRPDVMIVPSALPPFAKVVESVLVINPGYLSKRRGAGTYARMTLFPPKLTDEELDKGGMVHHKVFERARVEITRI
ncbi:DNA polymerase alpha, subunit B [Annulohypoxylon maeteangense]|uniref:DNA polymerase alpha, subunit B n=1 Tax=Annulohypoxylon maeteangense TaxID=1927788 RepID=UPI0020076D7F|nr:DNA polymerase alpha, subunit B [Annulohypoxylon maeteangense]KAI0883314.1 DNA polymerase alpha, subunit B [Annulohypoxylon maeteangense]